MIRLGSRWILFISGPDEDCRGLLVWEEPSEVTSGDPVVILSSEGPEDVETSPPGGASLWLGVEDFLGLTALIDNLLGLMV